MIDGVTVLISRILTMHYEYKCTITKSQRFFKDLGNYNIIEENCLLKISI